MAEILYQWGIPSICRNGRGTELQYDRWKNQQSATEKGESRSTKEEEICPFCVCINTAVRLQRNRESQCRGGIRGWRWSGIVNR